MEKVRQHDLEFHVQRHGGNPVPDLVLLHGFLGNGQQFAHLFPELSKVVNPVTIDIIPSHPDARLDAPSLVEGLQETITRISAGNPALPWILGYSMGGRLALSWAVRYPDSASGLILESTTAGIADPESRALRREADDARAQRIRHDFSGFLEEWEKKPLFRAPNASDGTGVTGKSGTKGKTDAASEIHRNKHCEPHTRLAAIQRSKDPEVMARWLSDFGTGSMPPLWDELHHLQKPVLLITGESDPKFCDLAERMARLLPNAHHETIPNAAHRVHVDNPAGYLFSVIRYLG
ncbi:MAG: alpha/beta fold hydrolase [Cyclonatronaceae bacterium]